MVLYGNYSRRKDNIYFSFSGEEAMGDLESESNKIQAILQNNIGNSQLKYYETQMQQKMYIRIYDGVSFNEPQIRFIYNTAEEKMYFKIIDKNFSKCILCSNILENIIDDNFDLEKKRKGIYELDDKYLNQFFILPQPSDVNDKNNSFYPCYSAYNSIFGNTRVIMKLYNRANRNREEVKKEIYALLDKEMRKRVDGEYNHVPNITNFRSEIEKYILKTAT